jgi:hypothetical protein
MKSLPMAPSRWFLAIVAASLLAAPSCKPSAETRTGAAEVATPSPTEPSGEELDATLDIKRVSVFSDTTARPETIKVRKKTQIVVWALKGEGELNVSFPDSPFGDPPQQPTCVGRFCVILYPPREGSEKPPTEGHEGRVYKYDVTVKTPEGTTTADPHAEVVP